MFRAIVYTVGFLLTTVSSRHTIQLLYERTINVISYMTLLKSFFNWNFWPSCSKRYCSKRFWYNLEDIHLWEVCIT